MFKEAFIPYGGYYSSPFCRWQGQLATIHSIPLAGATVKRWLASKGYDSPTFDYVNFGSTIPQPHSFYSATWLAALTGNDRTCGVWISQACSTSTTCVGQAALLVDAGAAELVLNIGADRMSNGPHTVWPNPTGPGGLIDQENWIMDNFNNDPWAGEKMVVTADIVAREASISRQELDDLAVARYEQYRMSLADDRAFQKRYFFSLEVPQGRKGVLTIDADEGITPCSAEGLAGLRPVEPDGLHSYGVQTHPADGNAALIVGTRSRARELAGPGAPEIQIVSYGFHRAPKARMAVAPVPAARMALDKAGLQPADIKVWKTHNPFAVNDVYMAQQLGIDAVRGFNDYGSSLIYGHPQGPTMARAIIEGIEQLVIEGGGYGCMTGCAAGDTGAALIVKVG
jgi:acetyl-CoA acetyltransferase family protein